MVKNVANEEERNTAISLWWDLAEQSRPEVKRNDPATWRDENWVADTTVGIMSGLQKKKKKKKKTQVQK